MLPNFLFPEQAVTQDGEGAALEIGDAAGAVIQLTLGITDLIEQESIDVTIYGSAAGVEWSVKPLATFPQKFYKGMYTILLDLTPASDVHFLKVKYKMNRWGHWTTGPMFKFFVFAEPLPGGGTAGA
jgi:hypothetical protein